MQVCCGVCQQAAGEREQQVPQLRHYGGGEVCGQPAGSRPEGGAPGRRQQVPVHQGDGQDQVEPPGGDEGGAGWAVGSGETSWNSQQIRAEPDLVAFHI